MVQFMWQNGVYAYLAAYTAKDKTVLQVCIKYMRKRLFLLKNLQRNIERFQTGKRYFLLVMTNTYQKIVKNARALCKIPTISF